MAWRTPHGMWRHSDACRCVGITEAQKEGKTEARQWQSKAYGTKAHIEHVLLCTFSNIYLRERIRDCAEDLQGGDFVIE